MSEKKEKTEAELAAERDKALAAKTKLAAERDKALAEAHKKYVAAMEAARKEYVAAKKRINPELARPTPREQEKTIKELKEKVALLEKQIKEEPK